MIAAGKQFVQGGHDVRNVDLRQEAELAEIDPHNGRAGRRHFAGGPQNSAVPAEHHHTLGFPDQLVLRDAVPVHRQGYRGILAHQDGQAPVLKQLDNLSGQCPDPFFL